MPLERTDTQYTHHEPNEGGGLGGGGTQDALATRRAERETARLRVVMCPRGGSDPASVISWGPKAAVGEGGPHRWCGASAWMHRGNSEGRRPFPCGFDTEQWNRDSPGALLAQPPKGTEGAEVRIGQTRRGRARGGERPIGTAACGEKGLSGGPLTP